MVDLIVTLSLGHPAPEGRRRDESRRMPTSLSENDKAIFRNPDSYDCPACTTGYDPVLHVACYKYGGVSRVLPIKARKP